LFTTESGKIRKETGQRDKNISGRADNQHEWGGPLGPRSPPGPALLLLTSPSGPTLTSTAD
jgi:hypothetical protein